MEAPAEDRLLWFAARTRHGQELGVRSELDARGIENFIPTDMVKSSRGKKIEKVLVNCLIFLRTTKKTALELTNFQGLPVKYMIDCATHTMMVVPEKQMEDFRRVFECSEEEGGLLGERILLGEKVKVTGGLLAGVEGKVLELNGKTYVVVGLVDSIQAKARVPRTWLEKID